ncbi:Protein dopey-1 [Grifola frondosa]|uniref:Protein dopey-1 n=1 Tax=Grifola frondosa TaxID=5627 RepID=A0A1C7MUH7_GRIFR|nr:Protein dopey-1 [Grifola frondosa]
MSATTSPQINTPEPLKKGPPWSGLRPSDPVSTYASDPKYKKYTQQVEKCLSSFDSVHEWADFISFLKQLLKTFQSYMQFKEIPRKIIVAKRLSQCLNPALPTGVHQRALDVYSHIFAVLGSEGLLRDLALWSSGLFPFFEYAATSVKPTVLTLFDTHYLPLQAGLRPVMKSFILALLPGLEEETGEYFDKVLSLLDRLAGTISQSFFFQNIWLVMLTTPSARGPALTFLSRRLPAFKPDEDVTSIVGRDIGLMIRAISAALEDDDIYVKRGALDILLQSLRIDSISVSQAQHEDRAILMRAATSVVLRRDVSLNRRIWSWLLGPDENSQNFFRANALELLRSTLRDEMFNPSAEYAPSRPFKIFISLLDKWEIGSPLTEVLIFDAFKAIKKSLDSGSDTGDEFMSMTASTLYEAVEPHVLWKQLLSAVMSDIFSDKRRCEGCLMVKYLLNTFHTHNEEVESIHLPVVYGMVMETLHSCVRDVLRGSHHPLHAETAASATRRCTVSCGERGTLFFACTFYAIERRPMSLIPRTSPAVPFITTFEDLVGLNILTARALLKSAAKLDISSTTRDVLVVSLNMLTSLIERLGHYPDIPYAVNWDPAEWSSILLACLNHEVGVRLNSMQAYNPDLRQHPARHPNEGSHDACLDTLKSEDPNLRRIGETWMRCSLKSYLRVLDPIIFDLFNPSIRRSASIREICGKQLQGFTYDRPFDQRYVNHLLETLLSVIRFGGQGFSRAARTTPINRSLCDGLLQRLESVSVAFPDASYMDVILHLLLRLLQSEPKSALIPSMHSFNALSQSVSVDLLQAVVARGEMDFAMLQTVETAVVQKLYFCVHIGRLDLQNKLLHLLHSIISASSPGAPNLGGSLAHIDRGSEISSALDAPTSIRAGSHSIHPLLIQTLVDGLSTPTNRPVLQHWLDFILMTVPQFQETLQNVVVPLSDSEGDIVSFTTDADFMMLLNALERLALLSLSRVQDAPVEEETNPTDRSGQESGGLLGYVSNVFSSDAAAGATDDQSLGKSSDRRSLYDAVRVLYSMWEVMVVPDDRHWKSREESLALIYTRTRTKCRRVLEHIFRVHSTEVLESIVDCWHNELLDGSSGTAAFDLVDILTSSAQNAVHMLCESIACRTPGLLERTKRQAAISNLTDMALFDFLEQYMRQLEGPLALQVWSRFLQLAKDLAASFKEFKPQAFPSLRCFTVLADKVSQTTAMEDRRIRRELQETYGKLLDTCVLVGRSPDQGSWIRRSHRETLAANGRDSPTLRVVSDPRVDEKMNASSTSLPDSIKLAYSTDLIEQINLYISSDVLPNLRKFLMEPDKILAACNQIVYNIIVPSLKGKARPLDIEDNILAIVREMTRIGAAVKAWRGPILDVLNDNRCFNSTPDAGGRWKPMIKSLVDTDKTALPELLSKVTTVPSANIFTNREYELLSRSLNLRRLSYVVLSGEKNHFLTQLPTIQEKLVDTLRNVTAPTMQSEVFWPVILAELYRLFDQVLISLPSDGSEELALILSACKLLDLLLVLQTEEFQIHQWIFITDTVDAVYRPDNWFPEAMLDRLAEVTGHLPVGENAAEGSHLPTATPAVEAKPMRRPMLQSLRQIDSIRDLVPFFSTASIASYESVYHSGGIIDWEAVERNLLEDLFDGR